MTAAHATAMRPRALKAALLLATGFAAGNACAQSDACAALTQLKIANVEIVSASAEAATQLPAPFPGAPAIEVAARCKVSAIARPVAGSRIGIEVWLPADEHWNGKLLGTGNGGYSSTLGYSAMAAGLARGYAVAGTDTGHVGDDMAFGRGNPEAIKDWAYRAIHEMTATAKQLLQGYYGRPQAHAYFEGCSTGGQQALSEVQRYPDDYDGVIAGAPGSNRIRLIYGFLWAWQALHDADDKPLLTPAKLSAVGQRVLQQCDAVDGLRDGVIDDPRRCDFDPAQMQCAKDDGDDCLSAVEVAAVRKVYADATRATGERLFPGWMRGSEAGWGAYLLQPKEPPRMGLFRDFAFNDPDWDWRGFDWNHHIDRVDALLPWLDATDADLSGFRARGGKLLLYTGWEDPVVPAQDTLDYHAQVLAANGGQQGTDGFLRLFVAPGMGHCGFGRALVRMDMLDALEQWVEQGKPPAALTAHYSPGLGGSAMPTRTRPVCAWPQVARYRGEGSIDDAANFECRAETPAGEH